MLKQWEGAHRQRSGARTCVSLAAAALRAASSSATERARLACAAVRASVSVTT